MKLATLENGARDGKLVVVSRDLTRFTDASLLVPTLQGALDDWQRIAPHLAAMAQSLEADAVPSERFHENDAHSPLPRAYQWADGSAYVNHVELVRKARGAAMPESFWTEPLMYQGGSDAFLGPREAIRMADEAYGIDMEAEIAVIVSDVPMGTGVDEARDAIRLVVLVNDVSLRGLIPAELAKGFGFFQGKPSSAFSPIAVTPDELGTAWDGGKVSLPLLVGLNGKPFGRANAGIDMTFDRDRLGFSLVNIISVTLATHNRDNARRFGEFLARLPEVLEAHALTGEMDYILKVVTPDLKSLSDFVNGVLLPHESVQHVKTAIVLETLKETGALPI